MTTRTASNPVATYCASCHADVVGAACRICARKGMASVLCLGRTPLANDFRSRGAAPSARYPLHVMHCESCALTQLADSVAPERLFSEYAYFSSASAPVIEHGLELSRFALRELDPPAASFVVDIGSNDGYLLRAYAREHFQVLGIDPATNITAEARSAGVPTLDAYFSEAVAGHVVAEHGRADLIHANNVLAHVPDVLDFLSGCRVLLSAGGHLIIEVPYVADLVTKCLFDTIYHEHVYYFSMTSLCRLLDAAGLRALHVERNGFHGGSLRVVAGRGFAHARPSVARLLAAERALGVCDSGYYRDFADQVHRFLNRTRTELGELAALGNRISGFGAPAKATIMMSSAELPLEYICDSTPYKQDKLLPGTGIPIVPPDRLETDPTEYCVIFAWNYADSIIAANHGYLRRGGTFVRPVNCKLEYVRRT
ncbi:MAG TPA: class I SAM-dependent methyltransferase [Actinocrinis sp.]|uniref:class I SAM-dependent methyltransferase n=1 Tax=Actinocrinis sp. TaxID=1920516 RepID=UPI002D2AF73F|nr:class I SAM-dependent methyltransferase [Actinocrinis sp.]HZU58207.1 class I SAM-dependent methyltransferase [Actinocrinis sp.]